MAATQGVYNKGIASLMGGSWDGTVKAMLLKTTYTFDRDHEYVADVVAHELSSANYVRKTLASKTSSVNQTTDTAYIDAADLNWSAPAIAAGQSVGYVVVFSDTGDDATAPLLFCYKLVATDPAGVAFNVQWNSAGLAKGTSPESA